MKSFILLILFICSVASAKVYDCFMFNNELDILTIRLNEMDPYVDYFVLVEWNRGHRTGNLKPCHYQENEQKYREFQDKIIHIKLDEIMPGNDGWIRENWHRNQIMRGLVDCQLDDLIFISDVDEMIPGNQVKLIEEHVKLHGALGFWQTLYRWFLNRQTPYIWSGTIAIKYKELVSTTPQDLRNLYRSVENLPRFHIGWHFTSMGGFEHTTEKYYHVVEGSDEYHTYEEWRELVERTTVIVDIDDSYPQFIQDNLAYFSSKDFIDK